MTSPVSPPPQRTPLALGALREVVGLFLLLFGLAVVVIVLWAVDWHAGAVALGAGIAGLGYILITER